MYLRYYAFSMHSTMLAGAEFVLHSAGWLDGVLCSGFEKLVMDADRLGSYQKILGQGLDVSDEALARDAFDEVGPGGHFRDCGHTICDYQNALYEPKSTISENGESWEEAGAEDIRLRAFKRRHFLLEQYEAPPLDVAVKEALDAFVPQRKGSMLDAWY